MIGDVGNRAAGRDTRRTNGLLRDKPGGGGATWRLAAAGTDTRGPAGEAREGSKKRPTEAAGSPVAGSTRKGWWASAGAGQTRLALICALFGGCTLVLVWRLFTFQMLD